MASSDVVCDKSESTSDYGDFKERYNKELEAWYDSQSGTLKKPWTRARISEVINLLKQSKFAMVSGARRTPMQYYWCAKYDVHTIDGQEILILKKSKSAEPTIRVVAIEDYFDFLLKFHKETGHGGRDKLSKLVKKKYYIQKRPLELFVAMCPTCEMKRSLPKKTVSKPIVSKDINSSCGLVEIIDFQSAQDGIYKFLLSYQDNVTKFVQYRPLVSNEPSEIATELVKIFLIFGAPYVLQSVSGHNFIVSIIEEVLKIWPQCKIIHGSPQTQAQTSNFEYSKQVVDMITTWMRDNYSTNWSLGCHFVQYQKNSSYDKIIGRSPYRALFGCDPKVGLQSLNILEDIVEEVNLDEDSEDVQIINEASASSQFKDNSGIAPGEAKVDTCAELPADAQSAEPPAARNICAACRTPFDGFVYRCVQCEYQMCSACDRVGEHRDHYVLRVPEHSPPSEVESVLARVRAALQPLQLKPPQRAKKKIKNSGHQPPEHDDTDSVDEEEAPVEVKMELDIHEHDPLEAFELPVVKSEPLGDVPPRPVNVLQTALLKSAPQRGSAPPGAVSPRPAAPTPTAAQLRPAAPHCLAVQQPPPGGPYLSGSTMVEIPQTMHVEEVNIKVEPQDEEEVASTSAASPAPFAKRPAGGVAPGQEAVPKRGRPKKKKMETLE